MIEFTDSEGRKRTDVDGNNQYLNEAVGVFPPYGESWHLADTWSLDLAAKLITTGWPSMDIEADKVDAKLPICKRCDEAKGRLRAYFHFVELAKKAIDDGILSDNDSPHAWLDWAQSKHYKITHLTKYLGLPLSAEDAAFFAGIDAMLEPRLKPVDYDAPASDEAATTQKRQRQDALAVELDEILVSATSRTPAKVMARLRERIGKQNTCILRNVGDGIEWENDHGDVKSLTIKLLGERIREWKKTGLRQG